MKWRGVSPGNICPRGIFFRQGGVLPYTHSQSNVLLTCTNVELHHETQTSNHCGVVSIDRACCDDGLLQWILTERRDDESTDSDSRNETKCQTAHVTLRVHNLSLLTDRWLDWHVHYMLQSLLRYIADVSTVSHMHAVVATHEAARVAICPGLWPRSQDGPETYQRLVSVSAIYVSCPHQFSAKLWRPHKNQLLQRWPRRRLLSRSRSFKVTNFDTNRKPVCDFEVNNTKVHHISYYNNHNNV